MNFSLKLTRLHVVEVISYLTALLEKGSADFIVFPVPMGMSRRYFQFHIPSSCIKIIAVGPIIHYKTVNFPLILLVDIFIIPLLLIFFIIVARKLNTTLKSCGAFLMLLNYCLESR